ncbi:MAG: hypothetical protein WC596_01275 [Candidatus Shapirobacteria bacterium]
MKFFNYFLLLVLIFTTFTITNYYFSLKTNPLSPLSLQDKFQKNLFFNLNLAKLEPIKTTFKYFQNEIEITFNHQNYPLKVIFSTQKNPTLQVASLQKIIKIATIKSKRLDLIDLSLVHPYATLKDN